MVQDFYLDVSLLFLFDNATSQHFYTQNMFCLTQINIKLYNK